MSSRMRSDGLHHLAFNSLLTSYTPKLFSSMSSGPMLLDDWHAYAFEVWGISITSWTPLPERAETLPDPLEYDVLQDGLMELGQDERRTILQGVSCYQVSWIVQEAK